MLATEPQPFFMIIASAVCAHCIRNLYCRHPSYCYVYHKIKWVISSTIFNYSQCNFWMIISLRITLKRTGLVPEKSIRYTQERRELIANYFCDRCGPGYSIVDEKKILPTKKECPKATEWIKGAIVVVFCMVLN